MTTILRSLLGLGRSKKTEKEKLPNVVLYYPPGVPYHPGYQVGSKFKYYSYITLMQNGELKPARPGWCNEQEMRFNTTEEALEYANRKGLIFPMVVRLG